MFEINDVVRLANGDPARVLAIKGTEYTVRLTTGQVVTIKSSEIYGWF